MTAACVLLLGVATGAAQSPPEGGSDDADLAAIRQASRDFAAAFNEGNAAGLAEHWTDDGEYRDEAGQVFTGRAAIQQEYEQFFAEHPGIKIRIHIDSLRLLGDRTAIEDGRASVDPAPPGAPAVSQYTAVHVQANVIRGNYTDTLSGKTELVHGSVDKQTQRVAFTVGDNTQTVVETGLYNLTKDEAPALMHFGQDRTEQWLLVRQKDPKTSTDQ